jgi:carbon-monoxide dehydrogenase medium subunit
MRYERPHSIEDAVGLLAASDGTAVILAGGSDLLVRMKGGFVEPDLIVDIKAINGLNEIRETAESFSIDRLKAGAGTLHDRGQSLQRLAGGG